MVEQGGEHWFYIAMVLLLLAWGLNVWVPVLLMKPVWHGPLELLELTDPTADAPEAPRPPSPFLPLLAGLSALAVMAMGVRMMHLEQHIGGRWLWGTAAAIVAFLWAVVVLVVNLSAMATYVQQHLSML